MPPGAEAFLACEPERLAALELLVSVTFPTYGQVADVFHLIRGPSFPHARALTREKIETGARRYDRYALRLLADGVELRDPTALALIASLAAGQAGESIGYAAPFLKQTSLDLRGQWRELHPEKIAAAARRRRDRRIARLAENLASDRLQLKLKPRDRGVHPADAPLGRGGWEWDRHSRDWFWSLPERARVQAEREAGELAEAQALVATRETEARRA